MLLLFWSLLINNWWSSCSVVCLVCKVSVRLTWLFIQQTFRLRWNSTGETNNINNGPIPSRLPISNSSEAACTIKPGPCSKLRWNASLFAVENDILSPRLPSGPWRSLSVWEIKYSCWIGCKHTECLDGLYNLYGTTPSVLSSGRVYSH